VVACRRNPGPFFFGVAVNSKAVLWYRRTAPTLVPYTSNTGRASVAIQRLGLLTLAINAAGSEENEARLSVLLISEEMGVARKTARRALEALKFAGLISVISGGFLLRFEAEAAGHGVPKTGHGVPKTGHGVPSEMGSDNVTLSHIPYGYIQRTSERARACATREGLPAPTVALENQGKNSTNPKPVLDASETTPILAMWTNLNRHMGGVCLDQKTTAEILALVGALGSAQVLRAVRELEVDRTPEWRPIKTGDPIPTGWIRQRIANPKQKTSGRFRGAPSIEESFRRNPPVNIGAATVENTPEARAVALRTWNP